jgi:hypothetical protein
MSERAFEKWLDNLGPDDLSRDLSGELRRFGDGVDNAEARLKKHLEYLRLISARKVILPDDLYFAKRRRRVLTRVTIRPVSLGARIHEFLFPQAVRTSLRKFVAALSLKRPIPGVTALVSAVLLLMIGVMLFYPAHSQSTYSGVERYLVLQERFSVDLDLLHSSNLLDRIDAGQIDILLQSAAMLSSPASLSRSWSFGIGRK